MEQEESAELPVLPVVRQPAGLQYYLGTWSGRILLLNLAVFIVMVAVEPSSLWMPSQQVIRDFGSKSLSNIAMGEYWRFISPIFVHIGAIHFLFNTMALYYIGYQLEYILGARWFLLIYLVAGVVGNLSSCLFSLALSAGASGAIFGLLGSGYRIEGLLSDAFDREDIKKKPRKRIYSGLVITNIVLGLIIPVIDNSAHIGGLVSGWLLTEAMLRVRPNRLRPRNPRVTYAIFAIIFVFACVSVFLSTDKQRVTNRYISAGRVADSAKEAYQDYTDALRIEPLNEVARLYRGQLLLQVGETDRGLDDIKVALVTGKVTQSQLNEVIQNLEMSGQSKAAQAVRDLSETMEKTDI